MQKAVEGEFGQGEVSGAGVVELVGEVGEGESGAGADSARIVVVEDEESAAVGVFPFRAARQSFGGGRRADGDEGEGEEVGEAQS